MNYKIEGALKRNRKNFIIFGVLWLIIAIVLISSFVHSSHVANLEGKLNLSKFFETLTASLSNPFGTLGSIFSEGQAGDYFSALGIGTVIYSVFFFIGIAKSAPKNEYTNIEHGSSDWSERGEQYKILSRNKGIILADNNYLPVDKRGNVNVLVVGRFRLW